MRRAARRLGLLAALLLLASGPLVARAQEGDAAPETDADAAEARERHPVLLYIPNRIFDLLDVVRLRVRIGPGIAANARATEAVSVNAGAYATFFVGLPGPRGKPRLNLPVGVESYAGAGVSVVEAETRGDAGAGYGPLEAGAGFQAAVIGLDVGVDPLELVDLTLGLLFIDLRDDDL